MFVWAATGPQSQAFFSTDHLFDLFKIVLGVLAAVLSAWFAYRMTRRRERLDRRRIACEELADAISELFATDMSDEQRAGVASRFSGTLDGLRWDLGNWELFKECRACSSAFDAANSPHDNIVEVRTAADTYMVQVQEALGTWRGNKRPAKVKYPEILGSDPRSGHGSDF